MASKTISVTKKGSLSECAGLWKDMSEEEIEELREGIKEMRTSLTSSVEESGAA